MFISLSADKGLKTAVYFSNVTSVVYAEGTVILSGKEEVRIYVKKRFWDKLRPLIGREVRLIMLMEEDEGI